MHVLLKLIPNLTARISWKGVTKNLDFQPYLSTTCGPLFQCSFLHNRQMSANKISYSQTTTIWKFRLQESKPTRRSTLRYLWEGSKTPFQPCSEGYHVFRSFLIVKRLFWNVWRAQYFISLKSLICLSTHKDDNSISYVFGNKSAYNEELPTSSSSTIRQTCKKPGIISVSPRAAN